jgi:hypothetical protein
LQRPLQAPQIEGCAGEPDDAAVEVTYERQPTVSKEIPGANRICVLAIRHEDGGTRERPQLVEIVERPEKDDIGIAVEQLLAGEKSDVEELQRKRIPSPKAQTSRMGPQPLFDPLVGVTPGDQIERAERRLELFQVSRIERPVVVHSKGDRVGRTSQQARQRCRCKLGLSVANESGNRLRHEFTDSRDRRIVA